MARMTKTSLEALAEARMAALSAEAAKLGLAHSDYPKLKGFDYTNGSNQVRGKGTALNQLYGQWKRWGDVLEALEYNQIKNEHNGRFTSPAVHNWAQKRITPEMRKAMSLVANEVSPTEDEARDLGEFLTLMEILQGKASAPEQLPYIEETVTTVVRKYNPKYGDERLCKCGHTYDRHFDSYDDMSPVGCKYCSCHTFVERKGK